jgi:GTP-binding protein HflX
LFERPEAGERAILVHIDLDTEVEDFDEFHELAISAGVDVVGVIRGRSAKPRARFFAGKGKVEEIALAVSEHEADVVLFNHELSAVQERNLEEHLGCGILDRNALILDIFAQRARSAEGKLQVELAQLRHLSTRLIRGWTHLERQKGGIGLRGPGETQLETDRRLVAGRVRSLKARLEKLDRQRAQGRRARQRAGVPAVSVVGYTNAGKSTLFNSLTGADVESANKLFATLDPTVRRLASGSGPDIVVADTVGFISHLPNELVAAFRSTLQETRNAALLLHVIDAADERRRERIAQVNELLEDIGVGDVPQIQVYNKIDLLGEAPRVERNAEGSIKRVWVSALSGAGMEELTSAVAEAAVGGSIRRTLRIPPDQGQLRSRLFREATVLGEKIDEEGAWVMDVEVPVNMRLETVEPT